MDAANAIEAEAYARLNVAGLTNLARVFQHVPENTMLEDGDVVIIGDLSGDGEEVATKGSANESAELTIAAVVQAEQRKPLWAIKAKVKELLHEHQTVRDGWQLAFFYKSSDGFLDPDTGKAYVGNFRFKVLAFAS